MGTKYSKLLFSTLLLGAFFLSTQAQATSTVQAGLTLQVNSTGISSLIWNGQNLAYNNGVFLGGWFTGINNNNLTCKAAALPNNTVHQDCISNVGGKSVSITVHYRTDALNTIYADISVTNNDSSAAFTADVQAIPLQFTAADPAIWSNNYAPMEWMGAKLGTTPVAFGVWSTDYSPNVSVFNFNDVCGWTYVCKDGLSISNIQPGQTYNVTLATRLTTDISGDWNVITPEPFAAYRAAFPTIVNWPDRRPIAAWFMADTGHASATNPYGYLNNPGLNVNNSTQFNSAILSAAQAQVTAMLARPVHPQGVVIWDVEGQQFVQPTTYIGDPTAFAAGYNPQMNAVADQLFKTFTDAGFKVGVTLRPDTINWVTALPSTCNVGSATSPYTSDVDVVVTNPPSQQFYQCKVSSPAQWDGPIPQGNGSQIVPQNPQNLEGAAAGNAVIAQVTATLIRKATYAHQRWGATLFYVDSSVFQGGAPLPANSIFRALQQALPDSLFMPEETTVSNLAVNAPFIAGNLTNYGTWVSEQYVYPAGFSAIYLSNCQGQCWTNDASTFQAAFHRGDIPLEGVPSQMNQALLNGIEAAYTAAQPNTVVASSLSVANAGSGYGMVFGSNNTINCGVNPGATLCSSPVSNGTSVTLTAAVANGSVFSGWSGACSGIGSCTVTVNGNMNVIANFSLQTITITSSAGANGTISPSGAVHVPYGATQAFTVTTSPGYTPQLTVDGAVVTMTNNMYSLNNVTAPHTVAVNYILQNRTITAGVYGSGGTISPSGAVSVPYGSNQVITMTPNPGYSAFATVDYKLTPLTYNSANNTYSYTFNNVTVNHVLSAQFTMIRYTVTTSAGPNGTISPPTMSWNYGSSPTISVKPNSGYTASLTLDGAPVTLTGNSYTLSKVTAAHTLVASFSLKTTTVTTVVKKT